MATEIRRVHGYRDLQLLRLARGGALPATAVDVQDMLALPDYPRSALGPSYGLVVSRPLPLSASRSATTLVALTLANPVMAISPAGA